MSVLIKGMEMPETCYDCPFGLKSYVGANEVVRKLMVFECLLTQKHVTCTKRNKWCPLAEVPPHGDLIDRSKLYEKTAEWEAQALHMVETTMNDEDTTEWRKWSTILTERSAFKFDVADAPTIIEAEGEEND